MSQPVQWIVALAVVLVPVLGVDFLVGWWRRRRRFRTPRHWLPVPTFASLNLPDFWAPDDWIEASYLGRGRRWRWPEDFVGIPVIHFPAPANERHVMAAESIMRTFDPLAVSHYEPGPPRTIPLGELVVRNGDTLAFSWPVDA